MFRQIGPMEIFIILGVVLLLFGGRKLPELARGSGRALRIFKSEVQELHDDKDDPKHERRDDGEEGQEAIDASLDPEPSSSVSGQTRARDPRPEQI